MADKPLREKPSTNGDRSMVVRNSALMEYSPGETLPEEYRVMPPEPPSFRDHLKVLFRQKVVIVIATLMTMAVVYVGFELMTPFYETNVRLLIRAEKLVDSPYYRDLQNSFRNEVVLTQAEIVKSNPVLGRVVKALKLDERPMNYERAFASPIRQYVMDLQSQWSEKKLQINRSDPAFRFRRALQELGDNVDVKPIPNTTIFNISARDFDPVAAATLANAVSHYYVMFDLEQQMAELASKYGEKNATVRQLQDDTKRFENRLSAEITSYADVMGPASTKILELAPVPLEPVRFPMGLVLLLGGLSGLGLGVMLAYLFERIDPTFRSTDDVHNLLKLPVLGSVPVRNFGSVLLKKPSAFSTRYTRSFQDLADHLSMLMERNELRTVLVTACSSGEGTSMVMANLCNYLSKNLGHKILAVDANLRRPALGRLFAVKDGGGLSEVLQGKVSLDKAIHPANDQLDILPTLRHEGSPLTLLNSPDMEDVLRQVSASYDMVLVDAPNLKDFKDTEVLATKVDGIVLVMEPGRARRQSVRVSVAELEKKKVNILGVILNKRIFHVPQILYHQV